ncbi:uncharacterized protein LOC62_02G003217 [Vanrija pseudolonga]|uniref:Uncharacterized protein n=1 Tax=Vanrija pseudolonga TaxID=143232 RepID=A0AAF0Y5D9_9TREE|nr:hypothetical protein LOC62_02G003217 [Vanrija pseudolonga]
MAQQQEFGSLKWLENSKVRQEQLARLVESTGEINIGSLPAKYTTGEDEAAGAKVPVKKIELPKVLHQILEAAPLRTSADALYYGWQAEDSDVVEIADVGRFLRQIAIGKWGYPSYQHSIVPLFTQWGFIRVGPKPVKATDVRRFRHPSGNFKPNSSRWKSITTE